MICISAKTFAPAKRLSMLALIFTAGFSVYGTAVAQQTTSQISVGQASGLSKFNLDSDRPDATTVVAPGQLPANPLTAISEGGGVIHAFPTIDQAKGSVKAASDNGPLLYHTGGSIMGPTVTIYPIFWVPAKLQNGGATGMSTHYQAVEYNMLKDFLGHGLGAIATQYYQKIGGVTTYVQNKGGLDAKGTYFVDTGAYPASGCHDQATPGNCLTDLQIRAEIQKVLTFANLTGGLNKIFMLFTSSGEGSCFDSTSQSCAYTQYCAYHSSFKIGSTEVIYANEPYGNVNTCQVSGAPSPNGDPAADAASTSASHELSEAITDPLGNAWFTSQGNENGDLCAYNYASATWDGGFANQMWNGDFYLLQTEYSNHTRQCLLVGP